MPLGVPALHPSELPASTSTKSAAVALKQQHKPDSAASSLKQASRKKALHHALGSAPVQPQQPKPLCAPDNAHLATPGSHRELFKRCPAMASGHLGRTETKA